MELSYKFPCYGTHENPEYGVYAPASGDLGAAIKDLLDHINSGTLTSLPVPRLPGFYCSGRMIGKSYALTVSKSRDEHGEFLDLPIPICTCYFATQDEDVEMVSKDAIQELEKAGITQPHPSFKFAMKSLPEAPFTAVVPWKGADVALQNELLTIDEVTSCTGFFQTIIGNAAAREDLIEYEESHGNEWLMSDMDLYILNPSDICAAVQTGGVLPSELIVEPGEEGYPQVYAYIMDEEEDVFRVDFDHDTMTFDTDGTTYLMLSPETLIMLTDLHEEAQEIWEEVDTYADDIDEALFSDADNETEIEDPISHLYTKHVRVEVSDDLSQKLTNMLTLSTRYAADVSDFVTD